LKFVKDKWTLGNLEDLVCIVWVTGEPKTVFPELIHCRKREIFAESWKGRERNPIHCYY